MSLFSKKITTIKADPFREMTTAIDAAINAARKAGIPPQAMLPVFEAHAAHFHNVIDNQMRDPSPQQYDAQTLRPIDSHGEARRAEERRTKAELARQQKEYRDSVNERGRDAARREGRIL